MTKKTELEVPDAPESPARVQRQKQHRQRALEKYIARDDETIRALKRLIRFYTADRDWFMVERLFNDLGRLEADRLARKAEVMKELYNGGKVNIDAGS